MTISAVIPTKNRAIDLENTVVSILAQVRVPDELIVIDQSDGTDGRARVEALCAGPTAPKLVYVHDQTVAGLVQAKARSLAHASGDLICFLEDDVVLDARYFSELEQGFVTRPGMLGCSGVITNPAQSGLIYRSVYGWFHRGVFTDKRPHVYAQVAAGQEVFVESNIINGGLSAWRRSVFSSVAFDVVNGFHMMEDAEFSTRVSRCFGPCLFINSRARLAHYPSPINRDGEQRRMERKVFEYVLFFKKNRAAALSRVHFVWLLAGLLLEATARVVRVRSLIPLRSLVVGLRTGLRRHVVES